MVHPLRHQSRRQDRAVPPPARQGHQHGVGPVDGTSNRSRCDASPRERRLRPVRTDGSIVFLDQPQNFVSSGISIMDGDGTNVRKLVGRGGTYSWPQVSPDGTMVAYRESGLDVGIVNIATGEFTILNASSEEPAWYGNDTLTDDDHNIDVTTFSRPTAR